MRKVREVRLWQKIMLGILSFVLIGTIGLATDLFAIVSHAESAAKVTAKSANIRKSADPTSEVLAGVKLDDKVSIKSQMKGTDGAVWYEVFVDAQQLGFIRSNLVSITDGSTPPSTTTATTTTTTTAATTTTTASNTSTINTVTTPPQAVVTEVNPISTTVKSAVRVRSDATTSSEIITSVQAGLAITVTGRAEDSDGRKWWRVNFTKDGTEVTGFIRSDFVETINPTDAGSEEPEPASEPEPTAEPEPAEETAWEVQQDDKGWWLVDCFGQYSEDHLTPNRYNIDSMFKTVEDNQNAYNEVSKTAKNFKVAVVILVIVIIGLAVVITLLFFKLRDMDDSAYFAEAERETARRRSADRPQGQPVQGGSRPVQGQRPIQGGQRPIQGGQRPAQGGQRPVQGGQRPAQGGQRPVQGGQRPVQGQRPAQGQPVQGGPRPVQGGQRPVQGGQRPVQGGQRPAQGQPVQGRPRPAQNPEAREQQRAARPQPQGGGQKAGWKSKNFMNEDDEFEILNWDGDEE